VTRTNTKLILETDFGGTRHEFPLPAANKTGDQTISISSSADGAKLELTVKEAICIDSMTGMPRPEQVTVRFNGRTLSGCAGDPATLLQKHEWKVAHLAGQAVLTDPLIRVTFATDGRLSGLASCNRFGAGYRITGEGLLIEKGMTSMMACDQPIMQQEQTFLRLLETVNRFSVEPDGSVLLLTSGQETIKLVKI
jgi:heat shock protein HslJ